VGSKTPSRLNEWTTVSGSRFAFDMKSTFHLLLEMFSCHANISANGFQTKRMPGLSEENLCPEPTESSGGSQFPEFPNSVVPSERYHRYIDSQRLSRDIRNEVLIHRVGHRGKAELIMTSLWRPGFLSGFF
jgi:hypothetical protein